MNQRSNLKSMITAALLAAFTCIFTMIIQIPTPPIGYIHPGDSLVLLSGVILGPVLGGIAAGIGSLLADILSGYAIYAIPTFLIKFTAAFLAGYTFRKLRKALKGNPYPAFLVSGIFGEIIVVAGYFLAEIILLAIMSGSIGTETLAAGTASALTGILPNLLQAAVGIILGTALLPLLIKIPDIKAWLYKE